MTQNEYRTRKLTIFEKAENGEIDDYQKRQLLCMLESKNDEEKMSESDIRDFFDKLVDTYPNIENDVKKLQKKIDNGDDSDSDDDDDNNDAVEEAVRDLISLTDLL